jgi:hypothetical protein
LNVAHGDFVILQSTRNNKNLDRVDIL